MTLAHATAPPSQLWVWSSPPPAVVLALGLAALAYARGVRRLRRDDPALLPWRRIAAFHGGLTVLALAIAPPLHALASTLFSAHMVQHVLIVVVAAPLLVAGRPAVVLAAGLRAGSGGRHVVASVVTRARALPLVLAPVITGLVLWAWHLPTLYELALANEAVHLAEHAMFLGAAVLFWGVLADSRHRGPLGPPAAVLAVLANAVQGAALGAVITFAAAPLYPIHAARAAEWGMPPLDDQRLAGVIMWVPPGLVYVGVMVALLVGWFAELDERTDGHLVPSVVGEGR